MKDGRRGVVYGECGESRAEHVDQLHGQVESRGAPVQTDAQIARAQQSRVLRRAQPRGRYAHVTPLLPAQLRLVERALGTLSCSHTCYRTRLKSVGWRFFLLRLKSEGNLLPYTLRK